MAFHHNNSITNALSDLFGFGKLDIKSNKRKLLPFFADLSFSSAPFHLIQSNFGLSAAWNDRNNRRKLFETYATQNGFDSLLPPNWYSQTRASLLKFKVAMGEEMSRRGAFLPFFFFSSYFVIFTMTIRVLEGFCFTTATVYPKPY